jgi:WD40 repeat protein
MPCSAQHALPTTSGGPDLQDEIGNKLDLGNANIEQTAVTMARDYPGEYSVNQVGAIYNSLVQGWSYYSDPNCKESYKNANLSLQDGVRAGTVGVGDCDDFAILIASLIESLGGSTRIIFSQDEETGQGHAYAEAYLGQKDDPRLAELENWIKGEFGKSFIPGMRFEDEEVWINLDYNSSYIGGPFFGGEKASRKPAWVTGNKTAPKIIPLIDSMDDLSGWMAIMDDNGSNISLKLMPSKKGKAIELEYDLKENGWVGIAKEMDRDILAELKGINLSYFLDKGQVELELRLEDENGTAFGLSMPIQRDRSQWNYLESFFDDFINMNPNTTGSIADKIDLERIDKLELIIHSSLNENDASGRGNITLDQIRGVLRVPKDSPWDKAEKAMAKDLALRSEIALSNPAKMFESIQLALKSLSYYKTQEGDLALRRGLALLPDYRWGQSHNGRANSVAFSSDGRMLATGLKNNSFCTSNATTGEVLWRQTVNESVKIVAFAPNGTILATCTDSGIICIWDTKGKKMKHCLTPNAMVFEMAFSPDGNKIAMASCDNNARLFSVENGTILHRMNHQGPVRAVAFSQDSTNLATGSDDGTVCIWDVKTGKMMQRLILNARVYDLAFNYDGSKLATADDRANASIWNIADGKLNEIPHKKSVRYVLFNHDGTKLATACFDDNIVRIWHLADCIESMQIEHMDNIESLVISSDGRSLASASKDKTTRIFNLITEQEIARMNHEESVSNIAFDPDGKKIATASNCTVNMWIIPMNKRISSEEDWSKRSLAFSADGTILASKRGNANQKETIVEVSKVRLENSSKPLKYNYYVSCLDLNENGTRIASVCYDNSMLTVKDLNSDKEILICNLTQKPTEVDLSREGDYVATVSGSVIAVREVWTSREIYNKSQEKNESHISLGPNGEHLVIAVGDRLKIIETRTSKELLNCTIGDQIEDVLFNRSGDRFAIITNKQNKIFNLIFFSVIGQEEMRLPPQTSISFFAFSPDGKNVAINSDNLGDSSIKLWNIEDREFAAQIEPSGIIRDMVFSRDELDRPVLITVNSNGEIVDWLVEPEDLIDEVHSHLSLFEIATETYQNNRRY